MKTRIDKFLPMRPLPQFVPSRVCLACEVCCRFPEPDSFLRPHFTREEITKAVNHGIADEHFPHPRGGQISVVPPPDGEGYVCPAFDVHTSQCRIYDVRPLDCQIYPFTLMWNAEHNAVLLGWDQKCPFMMAEASQGAGIPQFTTEAQQYASQLQERFEREPALIDIVVENPGLITRFQEDVVLVARLEALTNRLVG